MQIVIPMAGFGERFRRAGYAVPKPLIVVDGRPMISHVIDLFPGEAELLFVCNREHLDDPRWRMRELLTEACPTGTIVGIAPHRGGPIRSVIEAIDHLAPDGEVVIGVCDFNFPWDWAHFRQWVHDADADGCVVCYRGFHPHLLRSVHYAHLQQDEGWATRIQEKAPFTDDPVANREPCSNGIYYFKDAAMVRHYLPVVAADESLAIAGEHYTSQAFQPMIDDGLAVAIYDVQHFLQWGSPRDLEEYQQWAEAFAARVAPRSTEPVLPGTLLIPMAGLGQRFADAGYALPKPLIPVDGVPMVVQAARDLPRMERTVFVLRRDLSGLARIEATLEDAFPGCTRVVLDGATDGQARTCTLALRAADVDLDAPLVIGACDNGVAFDAAAHAAMLADPDTDAVIWAMRGHPGARIHPEMYGWIVADGERVQRLSVKIPLDDPTTDPAVIGAFSFRRAGDFLAACDRMYARDGRARGEFYVDTAMGDAVALGQTVRLMTVEHYYGWGTPDDLRTYTYWQSHFHKWADHPYRLELDGRVPPSSVAALDALFAQQRPAALKRR